MTHVSSSAASKIPLLFDQTDELDSVERPFRPVIVSYTDQAAVASAASLEQNTKGVSTNTPFATSNRHGFVHINTRIAV